MIYFYPLKIFFKSSNHAWSAMRTTCSLSPDSSATSRTYPKVSPIIAMSMFMNTTEIMKVARTNIKNAKYLS